jgi:hypothetical protein
MVTNFGTTTPAVGSTWYNAGATVTISATAPGAGGGERYVWNGWTGTGSGSYTGTNNPANNAVTMNAPITETASWTHQYQLTVTASPSGAIGGTFSVTYTQSGIVHTNEAHTTTWTGWADAGTSATVSSPQSPYGIYTFSSYTNNPATMNSAQTITLTYTAAPQTITLRPNAAGTTTQLENSGTGGANWDRVDEVTADESTTYVYGESDDNRETDTYNVADQSLAGTITNVRIYIRALENYDRDDVYAWTAIRIGTGSIQYGTQIDLTTSWTNYNTNYATKTGNLGSGAWTWADINNLQIGVGLQSHESSGPTWRYAECTQVWVEITYTP